MAADVTALKETDLAQPHAASASRSELAATVRRVLMPLASLKLTVVLFGMAIFLVFASTLAQKEHDIWHIVREWYRVDHEKLFPAEFPWINPGELFVYVRLQYFFPDAFFPSRPQVPGGFLYPRGWVIGMLMGLNLLAAHSVRFTVQSRGTRLLAGIAVMAFGAVATWLAIESGASSEGILGEAIISWDLLWKLMLMTLAALAFGCVTAMTWLDRRRKLEMYGLGITAVVSAALLGYCLYYGAEARISGESSRIMWQLIKGTAVGLILLAGAHLAFKKRAGIVVLHAGIGLMFAYEVIVGLSHEERQISIFEGQTQNWAHDIRYYELAVTQLADESAPTTADKPVMDTEIVVPQSMLEVGSRIGLPNAPFDVRIVRKMQNSELRKVRPGDQNPAGGLWGAAYIAEEREPVKGTDTSGAIDIPTLYVELLEKQTSRSLGTFMLSLEIMQQRFIDSRLPAEVVEYEGRSYELDLRSKRTYRPYKIKLLEVRKDDYLASDTPRNYSSVLEVVDPTRDISARKESIKMNNPMRFADETFYQSGYKQLQDGRKFSTIQVVENAGWMLPYVSCMIVVVGCAAQFGSTLTRFLNRRQGAVAVATADVAVPPPLPSAAVKAKGLKSKQPKKPAKIEVVAEAPPAVVPKWLEWGLPSLLVLSVLAMTARTMMVPTPKDGEMDFYAFGQLPVAYESRVKPFDSMARSTLAAISHRQTFKMDLNDDEESSKPAIRWLLDVMTRAKGIEHAQVFRIDNLDVLKALGLERNEFSRYSYAEVFGNEQVYGGMIDAARKKASQRQDGPFEREVLKLRARRHTFDLIHAAFSGDIELPTAEQYNAAVAAEKPVNPFLNTMASLAQVRSFLLRYHSMDPDEKVHPPLGVPDDSGEWELYTVEAGKLFANRIKAVGENPATNDPVAKAFYGEISAIAPTMISMLDAGPTSTGFQKFHAILEAYKRSDAAAFNTAVADYRSFLNASPPSEYDPVRRDSEAYLNHAEPFFWCSWYYLLGFIVTAIGWLGFPKLFNRAAFALIVTALLVHAGALAWRIYVTQRPPVINLYSSAVFIGFGAVLFGVVYEAIYKLGIGNVIAGIAGFGSLMIAHLLSRQGDTIEALQAVLDTQFWLTTHVVCITLGYAVTYVAGLLGAFYILCGVLTRGLSPSMGKEISRMIYGTLCFALFFSFFGTVLGGLWADDSWGRFWGWDPKENGALIIVLWNALVLHARWDGWVKERGMAVLAVIGNVTTSWSWFGVNQLGVGLHAYGFSAELLNLLAYLVAVSLLIAAVGSVPRRFWWSDVSRNLA